MCKSQSGTRMSEVDIENGAALPQREMQKASGKRSKKASDQPAGQPASRCGVERCKLDIGSYS